jgi:hypothetical protein
VELTLRASADGATELELRARGDTATDLDYSEETDIDGLGLTISLGRTKPS